MPRIYQLSGKYAVDDFLQEIRTRQGSAGLMNVRALADAADMPYQTLLRRLEHPETFTLGEIAKLVKVIRLSPSTVLSFIGYSKKETDSIEKEFHQ